MNWIELVSKAAIDAKNIKKDGIFGVLTPEIYSRDYLKLMVIMFRALDVPINVTEDEHGIIEMIEFHAAENKEFYCRKGKTKGERCKMQCLRCSQIDSND